MFPPGGTISIHAPIVGCDQHTSIYGNMVTWFQSTHPSWGATYSLCNVLTGEKFQSTHPSWGATVAGLSTFGVTLISIHAPIVGCDQISQTLSKTPSKFQSTHPSWGATWRSFCIQKGIDKFQSTHPSWGATIVKETKCRTYCQISIHAPIVGCDKIKEIKKHE